MNTISEAFSELKPKTHDWASLASSRRGLCDSLICEDAGTVNLYVAANEKKGITVLDSEGNDTGYFCRRCAQHMVNRRNHVPQHKLNHTREVRR